MKNTIRLAAVLLATTVSPVSAESDLRMGERLYQENCASCHGANLEGQPDWRTRLPNGRLPAPPHDASGHTWHHTDRVLTDDEITSIVDYIKSTWPDKERAFQSERTREDQQAQP